jgi:hypothetical protein
MMILVGSGTSKVIPSIASIFTGWEYPTSSSRPLPAGAAR